MSIWRVDRGVPPFSREGYEVKSVIHPEIYWFQTEEWARLCATQFNRLENIKYENQTITIGSNVSIKNYEIVALDRGDWTCYLFGSDEFQLIPKKGEEPNWFWRKMQYLAFGNKWVKKNV